MINMSQKYAFSLLNFSDHDGLLGICDGVSCV